MAAIHFHGYRIVRSGKAFLRVIAPDGHHLQPRVTTYEGAQALILAQGRVMTRKEHALVYNKPVSPFPTAAQALSEHQVRTGQCDGYLD